MGAKEVASDKFTCSEAEEKLTLMALCLVNRNKSISEHLMFHYTNRPMRPIMAGGYCYDKKVRQVLVCLLQKSMVFLIIISSHKLEQRRSGG